MTDVHEAHHDNGPLSGLRGRLIDAPTWGDLREWRDGVLLWDSGGMLRAVGSAEDVLARFPKASVENVYPALVFPGLIDLHTHLPQYAAAGRGAGELLPWLERYIFPLERSFNEDAALADAPGFFRELAKNGTTTAGVYLALWEDSADISFQAAEASGLRVVMGKMMMDDVSYSDTAPSRRREASLAEAECLCERWNGRDGGRIHYAVSPRFAVSCSESLLRGAAELAHRMGAYLQTHISENAEELHTVARRFPDARDYTDVYDRAGLLGSKTLLGHAIHLSDREIQRLAETETRAVHCPTSNMYLSSGLMPLDTLRNAGVVVGLGSDVAGGPELNMWRVMRGALEVRNIRASLYPNVENLRPRHVFHMATSGGAAALQWERKVGSFRPGQEADILVADPQRALPPGVEADGLDADEILSLCVWRGDDRMTHSVYVRGHCVWAGEGESPCFPQGD